MCVFLLKITFLPLTAVPMNHNRPRVTEVLLGQIWSNVIRATIPLHARTRRYPFTCPEQLLLDLKISGFWGASHARGKLFFEFYPSTTVVKKHCFRSITVTKGIWEIHWKVFRSLWTDFKTVKNWISYVIRSCCQHFLWFFRHRIFSPPLLQRRRQRLLVISDSQNYQ